MVIANIFAIIIAIISIILGVMILFFPKLLRWLIGLYFIIVGLIGLIGAL